jgi:hypothetical protein
MAQLETTDLVEVLGDLDALADPQGSPWRVVSRGETEYQIDLEAMSDGVLNVDPGALGALVTRARRLGSLSVEQQREKARRHSSPGHFCAWYQPIHYYGYEWGIRIRQECFEEVVEDLARMAPRAEAYRLSAAGLAVHLLHEYYHHKTESFAVRAEVMSQRPVMVPYHDRVYKRLLGNPNQLEEALANLESFRRLREPRYRRTIGDALTRRTRSYLRTRFQNQPPGYKQALRYLGKSQSVKAALASQEEHELQSRILMGSLSHGMSLRSWKLAPQSMHSLFNVEQRIFLVVPAGSHPSLPVFPSPHVSTKKAKRYLSRVAKGKEFKGERPGDHILWRTEWGEIALVEGAEQHINVLQDIARASGKSLHETVERIRAM